VYTYVSYSSIYLNKKYYIIILSSYFIFSNLISIYVIFSPQSIEKRYIAGNKKYTADKKRYIICKKIYIVENKEYTAGRKRHTIEQKRSLLRKIKYAAAY